MEKAKLRPLVLEILRQNAQTHFNAVELQIKNLTSDYQRYDALKLQEIIWELLIQGVLAPGKNSLNINLPFIHLTEYGVQCLEEDALLLHDPDGYLKRLQQRVGQGQPLDEVVLTYVRESLLTFLAGHYLAATVMLGVASGRCLDLLTQVYLNAISDKGRKEAFEKKVIQAGRSIKLRFDALQSELLALTLPVKLKDTLDIQLTGIFTLIRYSWNDAGHPTARMVDRDVAHGNLLAFPRYCQRIYELIDHFQSNSV